MKPFEGIARITSTVATKSVLNPTLILAAIVVPISLLLSFELDGQPQLLLFALAGAVVLVALLQIIGFSIFSEHLSRFGDAGGEVVVEAEGVLVNNPALESRRDV